LEDSGEVWEVGLKCETNDGDEIDERGEDGLGWWYGY
ncbi:hypothetical protein Tco_0609843, partial [Tanacetum coccineum]